LIVAEAAMAFGEFTEKIESHTETLDEFRYHKIKMDEESTCSLLFRCKLKWMNPQPWLRQWINFTSEKSRLF